MKRIIVFTIIFLIQPAFAKIVQTDSADFIFQEIQKLDPYRTLIVFDIDNTLLASDTDLGSEQWFEWQKTLMKNPGFDYGQIRESWDSFFLFVDRLNSTLKMHPVDPAWVNIVKDLQKKHYRVIVETSRSWKTQLGTERQFQENGFDFSNSAISKASVNLQSGLLKFTGQEVIDLKLGEVRPTSFEKGVYYTEGQHKGAFLRKLLVDLNQDSNFKDIVFIDNDYANKHIVGMEQMFARFSDKITVHNFKYVAENEKMDCFIEETDKDPVILEAIQWIGHLGLNLVQ
jgi:hypothetical protein